MERSWNARLEQEQKESILSRTVLARFVANPMSRTRFAAVATSWFVLVSVLLGGGAAHGRCAGEDVCGDCSTTGKVEYDLRGAGVGIEEGIEYCSVAMESDSVALGLGWSVCARCKAPTEQARAQIEFDREFGKRKKWLDERREEVDKPIKKEVMHLKTKHFVIAWGIPKVKSKGRTYKQHEAMHLYADRVEEVYEQIMTLHGITDRRTAGTVHYLYFMESAKDSINLCPSLQMASGSGGRVSKYGKESRMVTHGQQEELRKDEDFHQFVAHIVSHHVHNDVEICQNWLMKRYGWVSEGLAHYIEIRFHGSPNTWCNQEVGTGIVHWKGDDWEANVKKAMSAGEGMSLAELFGKASDSLTPKEHTFSWAYIDYLMWLAPDKVPRMLREMKGPQLPDRDAIKKAFGISVGELQDGFDKFVSTEYSARPRKGPYERPPKPAGQ